MRSERDLIKEQYRKLYSEVTEVLFRHDPMDTNFGVNTDEYDPEAGAIIARLNSASSERDVFEIVCEEFCEWFDLETHNKKDEPIYNAIAKEIWLAWLKFSRAIA